MVAKKKQARSSRKAVSPVIAVLLLIAGATAAAILVYAWSMGLIGTLTSGGGSQLKEQIIMEAYSWAGKDEPQALRLYLRNVGISTLNISAIYIEGVPASDFQIVTGVHQETTPLLPYVYASVMVSDLTMVPGEELTLDVTPAQQPGVLVNGAAYVVKVVTQTGGIFTFSCTYGYRA